MKSSLIIFLSLVLISCGKDGKNGTDGLDGKTFQPIVPEVTGIEMEDIEPGLACANGGISLFTFQDLNADGVYQDQESIIKVKSLCHGLNGTSAALTLENVESSEQCPQGGIKISGNGPDPVEVCNGANGLNGEQGIPGVQGVPGIAGVNGQNGADGTQVVPVKFCEDDNSTFPEYGLMIGEELFAVYWGSTPASPNSPQAFLTKLVAGNYMSTGGNNCLFSIE